MSATRTRLRQGGLLLTAGAICVFAVLGFGQGPTPNAKELAKRVDNHYNHLHSLKAGFTETYEGMGMNRTESGTMVLLKPGRMRWDYNSPAGKIFVLDGKYAWSYTRGDALAQRIPAKDLSDLRSPLQYLLGHAELARELKNLTAAPAAGGRFTLTGVPKGMEERMKRATLTVTAAGIIDGLAIEETDGAVTRFTFSDQQPNAPVSAATFHFTPPPGVKVMDSMPPI